MTMTIATKYELTMALLKGETLPEMEEPFGTAEALAFLEGRLAQATKSRGTSKPRAPKPEKLAFYAEVKGVLEESEEPMTAKAVAAVLGVTPAAVTGAMRYLVKVGEVSAYVGEKAKAPKTYAAVAE